jgi:multicomponent Na+:H+ antiporter subunit A
MPRHLEHEGRPAEEARRFWPWMVLFMGAMIGLACARDLVLLFVFFDLTAVASYFLIGFDRNQVEARAAALMAMLVTGISAVALLIGAVILYAEHGTFSLPALFDLAESGSTATTIAVALIAVAALAKSAQAPLHFWLPRAMAAPTPVSAYLHSAAMVAAGVLVIGRIHPLIELEPVVLDGLLARSACSRSSSAGSSRSPRTGSSRSSPTRRSPNTATSSPSTGSAGRRERARRRST